MIDLAWHRSSNLHPAHVSQLRRPSYLSIPYYLDIKPYTHLPATRMSTITESIPHLLRLCML